MIGRMKFYGVWKLSESCCLITGLGCGIDPETKSIRYDLVENVDILKFESGENIKSILDAWNKFTAVWLRNCVYSRIQFPALKLLVTLFISAFWHGFYPGFYLSFLFSVPLIECGRSLRRYVRPIFISGALKKYRSIYDYAGRFFSILAVNYLYACFSLRSFEASMAFWSSLYFFGHFMFLIPLVALNAFGLGRYLQRFHGAIKYNKIA
jgi:hypothetical protein